MTDSRSDPTIVQRLMQALEADTAVELARALGLPVADVEQALAKGQVPDEWVRICAAETGCNADWLFFGRGPMRLPLVESGAMPACLMLEDVDDDVDMITVPLVVARLSAGSGSLEVSSEQEGGYAFRSDFLHRKGNPRRMVLMRVSGDGMRARDTGQRPRPAGSGPDRDRLRPPLRHRLRGCHLHQAHRPAARPDRPAQHQPCLSSRDPRPERRLRRTVPRHRPRTLVRSRIPLAAEVSIHIFKGRGGLFPAAKSPPFPLTLQKTLHDPCDADVAHRTAPPSRPPVRMRGTMRGPRPDPGPAARCPWGQGKQHKDGVVYPARSVFGKVRGRGMRQRCDPAGLRPQEPPLLPQDDGTVVAA